MNLFVLAYSPGEPCDAAALEIALGELAGELPFFPGERVEAWVAPSGSLACAWIAHGPDRIGGVRYVHRSPDRIALFAGRPILWQDGRADGRAPLDPRFHLEASAETLLALDGRFVAARYDDAVRALEVVTDPLGAYPVYEARPGELRLLSNNAELLRRLTGARDVSVEAAAGLVAGGWPLGGDPIWHGVTRLRGAGIHRVDSSGTALRQSYDDEAPRELLGAGFDPGRAARLLEASMRALADWPGRPNVVGVTAGRDSRLVLGAAAAAGIDVCPLTGGRAGDGDVDVGARVVAALGLQHVVDGAHVDPRLGDWRRAARLVDLMASGTVSLADAHGYKLEAPEGPLVLWHSGQGGEIARGYYGTAAGLDRAGLTDLLFRRFAHVRPGLAPILSRDGEGLLRDQIGAWVAGRLGAGFAAEDVPDLFYLEKRMGTWAGPGHGCVEYVRDTTSPLWSSRLLPDELGAPAGQRAREVFHRAVLAELQPLLVDVPFEQGNGWPSERGRMRERLQPLVRALREAPDEARRRLAPLRTRPATALDRALPGIRELVLSQDEHDAWRVLDRRRVQRLLGAQPETLGFVRATQVWNLATVFAAGRAVGSESAAAVPA